MRSFVALRLLGVLAAVSAATASVEVLDDQSFTALVESGEPAFVKFYAPCASPPPLPLRPRARRPPAVRRRPVSSERARAAAIVLPPPAAAAAAAAA